MRALLTEAGLALVPLFSAGPPLPVPAAGEDSPDLGGPLIVNDVEISQNEIKRQIIYGPCRHALEYLRINAMIDWEIKLRELEGQDTSRFKISDEAFEKHYDKKIAAHLEKYPMLDLETEVRRAYRQLDWYRRELRQEMVIDEVFTPDDQDLWPDVTFEALRQEAGEILIDDFRQSYERRKNYLDEQIKEWEAKSAAGEDPGPYPELIPEDSMYRSILRQIVRDTYFQIVDTKSAKDGLPDDLILTMDFDFDGEPELLLTTDEMWDSVKHTVSDKEISDARLLLAILEAVRQRLAAEGKLMSEADAQHALAEVESSFVGSMFDLGQIAVGGHQFPSVEAYAMYFPLFESYKRAVLPTLVTDDGSLAPELREHLDHANKTMGLGKADCEVLLVSAFDFDNFRWKDDGWEWAQRQAERLKHEYEANAAAWAAWKADGTEGAGAEETDAAPPLEPSIFWSLLLDDHCEFWDPPQPVTGRPGSAVGYKQKGRFGERTRNDLRSMMSESPYTHFLYGDLLTDHLFFQQPVGVVEGPFPGPWGYYLTKVLRRTPPTRPLNVRDERHLDLLRNDYLLASFVWYAHGALSRAEVVGLPH